MNLTLRVAALCGHLACCGLALADEVVDARERAEKMLLETYCASASAQNAAKLAHTAIRSSSGIECAGKLLRELSTEALNSAPLALQLSDHLWSLVDHAILVPESRQRISALLELVRSDVLHPLRSEGWLGLRVLERESGRLTRVGGKLPYVYVPGPHMANLVPTSAENLRTRLESANPRLRRELAWLAAQMKRETVSRPMYASGSPLSHLTELSQVLAGYRATSYDFVEAFIDEIFLDKTIVTSPAPAAAQGSDILPPMDFTLTGSHCADGQCGQLNVSTRGLTNAPFTQSRPYNPDSSWANVHVNYMLNTPNTEHSLMYYGAGLSSTIRGGYWIHKNFLDIVDKTGDGTSTVNYTMRGIATIPRCNDPTQCTVVLNLWSYLEPSQPAQGTTGSITIEGPTGQSAMPAGTGQLVIDRSQGDHRVSVVLQRSAANTGGCCHQWVGQTVHVSLSKPVFPQPSVVNGAANRGPSFQIPAWMDVRLDADVGPFDQVGVQIAQRVATGSNVPGIAFAGPLSTVAPGSERRFGTLWSRLAYSRLARAWAGTVLTSTELSELLTLNESLSREARARLHGSLTAEMTAYSYARNALDPTPILLVIAALVRDTGVTESIDAAEAALTARIAGATESPALDALRRAKASLDTARGSSTRVDILLRLSEAEYEMAAKAREAQIRYERLARELAQLWAPAP